MADAPQVGTITELQGELWQGDKRLAAGDKIELGGDVHMRRGRAVIELDGGVTLRIFPKSKLRLSSSKRVLLLAGKIWAKVVSLAGGEKFAVETSNAVAGVRGTEFVVERHDGRTKLAVIEGKVAFANTKKPTAEVVVVASQSSVVEAEKEPTAPAKFEVKTEETAWQNAPAPTTPVDETATDKPKTEETPRGPQGPVPGVKSDRKAFEKLEREGEQKKNELQKESEAVRDSMKKPAKELEKDLEEQMKTRGSLKEKSFKTKKGKGRDTEMDDFLK